MLLDLLLEKESGSPCFKCPYMCVCVWGGVGVWVGLHKEFCWAVSLY